MEGIGKLLLIVGGITVIVGLILVISPHIPFLGKLPGDIVIKKEDSTFYFPVVSFLIISVILTVIVNVVLYFLRK